MTVTASKPISLSDLHAEFGGTGPLTDYYRGGGLVPSSRAAYYTYGTYTSLQFEEFFPQYYWDTGSALIYWDGVLVASSIPVQTGNYITGGYQYTWGTIQNTDRYNVRRRTAVLTPAVSINTSVPTSGDISLTDFYSATAS